MKKFSRKIHVEQKGSLSRTSIVWEPNCRDGPGIFYTRDGPQWYEYIRSISPSKGAESPCEVYKKGK